ncbi:MAG: Nif11-like leader peptide family natural product precursor [Rhodocyclales bacterium]|nr:Nif11-like leader peptide family natural product precursor [Rhodocyclales bacterium]
MSQAQIEQFASRVKNDPAMFNKLTAGTQTPDEFIDKAVALGVATGFTFSRAEADGWIKSQIEAKANGELSDLQLEGVAGGKGVAVNLDDAVNEVYGAIDTAANAVVNWFASW